MPCYELKQAHVSESITSEILELWGSFFFQNIGNLILISKMQKKKMQQKIDAFWDNSALFGNGKFPLLIWEYS